MKLKIIILYCLLDLSVNMQGKEIGNISPVDFLQNDENQSKSFSSSLISAFLHLPQKLIKEIIKFSYFTTKPESSILVQKSLELAEDEKIFLSHRLPKIQAALKKEFGIDTPLRIGFCGGGGGNRAMIGFMGLLIGACKSNIIDVTLYISGLSGSTWLLVPMSYLSISKNISPLESLTILKNYFCANMSDEGMFCYKELCSPALLSIDLSDDFFTEIAKRYAYDQPLTLVNLFGPLVANYSLGALGDQRLSVCWSSISHRAQTGNWPLPLCASIYQNEDKSYGWFEMSPFQAGSTKHGYIPTQYLGSYFKNNTLDLNRICHEYPISFYLGMYGSAFAITIQEINNMQKRIYRESQLADNLFKQGNVKISNDCKRGMILNNSFIQDQLKQWIAKIGIERNPITYAKFPDFSNDLAENLLGLFDAGIDFNFPIPTLISRPERALDIVIIYDSNNSDAKGLQKAYNHGISHSISMPQHMSQISNEELTSNNMTVFNDPRLQSYDKSMPTYLYFPTVEIDTSQGVYNTFNFKYLPEEINWLSNKMENMFLSEIENIKEIMKLVAMK